MIGIRRDADALLQALLSKLQQRGGTVVKVTGYVITWQRPKAAKGFIFLSLEGETGILNVMVSPASFEKQRRVRLSPSVLVKGTLQNTGTVVSVQASYVEALSGRQPTISSHDFH
ncbi:MAG: hypothetical protein JOY85_18135 [Acidobacteriaceae bacterium]|nr:hypothetical protein [Acidobacteriaceae bacterium]